jgi:hypothetical protein
LVFWGYSGRGLFAVQTIVQRADRLFADFGYDKWKFVPNWRNYDIVISHWPTGLHHNCVKENYVHIYRNHLYIAVRKTTDVLKDGEVISSTYWRTTLLPNDPTAPTVLDEPYYLNIANYAWSQPSPQPYDPNPPTPGV